ncbi:hypothetical protein ACRDU6_00270 (plasmid) [Mycolicibacterium sp. ELW1]|nr:hypothetical protein [Mycobacterium sp. ELW1]
MGHKDDEVNLLLEDPKKYIEKRERELARIGYVRPSPDAVRRPGDSRSS